MRHLLFALTLGWTGCAGTPPSPPSSPATTTAADAPTQQPTNQAPKASASAPCSSATACKDEPVSKVTPEDRPAAATAPTPTTDAPCKPGDAGCASDPPATADSSAPAGANLRVGSMTADGVVIKDLACKMDGLGLLGTVVVAATVSKQKAALRACGLSSPVPVTWTIKGGSATQATANTGDAKRDACVVKALKKIQSPSDGPCSAKLGLQ